MWMTNMTDADNVQSIFFALIHLFVIETPFFLSARFEGQLFYQQHMHKQQEKLQADILNSLPQSVVIVNHECDRIKFVNTPFLSMLNSQDDLNGDARQKKEVYLNRKIFLPILPDNQGRVD
jgi:c-di-AMP phosphodiesterase-like protein